MAFEQFNTDQRLQLLSPVELNSFRDLIKGVSDLAQENPANVPFYTRFADQYLAAAADNRLRMNALAQRALSSGVTAEPAATRADDAGGA